MRPPSPLSVRALTFRLRGVTRSSSFVAFALLLMVGAGWGCSSIPRHRHELPVDRAPVPVGGGWERLPQAADGNPSLIALLPNGQLVADVWGPALLVWSGRGFVSHRPAREGQQYWGLFGGRDRALYTLVREGGALAGVGRVTADGVEDVESLAASKLALIAPAPEGRRIHVFSDDRFVLWDAGQVVTVGSDGVTRREIPGGRVYPLAETERDGERYLIARTRVRPERLVVLRVEADGRPTRLPVEGESAAVSRILAWPQGGVLVTTRKTPMWLELGPAPRLAPLATFEDDDGRGTGRAVFGPEGRGWLPWHRWSPVKRRMVETGWVTVSPEGAVTEGQAVPWSGVGWNATNVRFDRAAVTGLLGHVPPASGLCGAERGGRRGARPASEPECRFTVAGGNTAVADPRGALYVRTQKGVFRWGGGTKARALASPEPPAVAWALPKPKGEPVVDAVCAPWLARVTPDEVALYDLETGARDRVIPMSIRFDPRKLKCAADKLVPYGRRATEVHCWVGCTVSRDGATMVVYDTKKAAIIDLEDGEVRAWPPPDMMPTRAPYYIHSVVGPVDGRLVAVFSPTGLAGHWLGGFDLRGWPHWSHEVSLVTYRGLVARAGRKVWYQGGMDGSGEYDPLVRELLDPATGRAVWRGAEGETRSRDPAVVTDDAVFEATRDPEDRARTLIVRRTTTGVALWEHSAPGQVEHLAVDAPRGWVLVAMQPGRVVVLDAKTGAFVWQHMLSGVKRVAAVPSGVVGLVRRDEKRRQGWVAHRLSAADGHLEAVVALEQPLRAAGEGCASGYLEEAVDGRLLLMSRCGTWALAPGPGSSPSPTPEAPAAPTAAASGRGRPRPASSVP